MVGTYEIVDRLIRIGELQEYLLGRQSRHMAVYAVRVQGMLIDRRESTGIMRRHIMASHTSLGDQLGAVHFIDMNIVAGGAIHLAHFKTFTGGKQSILVRMNVQRRDAIRVICRSGIMVQRIANQESEGGTKRLSQAGMTECTGVQSLLSAQKPGVNNIFSSFFSGMGLVESHMTGGRPVASFAVNSIDDAAFIEYSAFIPLFFRPGMGTMTFHTLPMDLLVKIDNVGRIAGAVAPTVQRSIVGYRQLEQSCIIPIKIGLSFPARAYDDVEGLALHDIPVEISGLKKLVFLFFHDHFHMLVIDIMVFSPGKTPFNKCWRCRAGIQVMGCFYMRVINIFMTGGAGGGANECGSIGGSD